MRYEVELYDRLVTVKDTRGGTARAAKNAPRGYVRGMSNKSRTRLLRLFAQIRRPDPAWFVTLTYHDFVEDFEQWKRDLDTFHRAIVRRYPDHAGLWRLQFQQRGAPHYHLLLWTCCPDETREDFEAWCACAWLRIIGQDRRANREHGVDVEHVTDIRGCGFYLALYNSDREQDRRDIRTGREWGVWHKERLVGPPLEKAFVDERGLCLLRRVVARCGRAFARTQGRKRRSHFWDGLKRQQPFTRFLPYEESTRLLRWVTREAAGLPSFVRDEQRRREARRASRLFSAP